MVSELIAALLVPAALIGILLFIFRSARPASGEGRSGARSVKALRRFGEPSLVAGKPSTAVAVVLLASLAVATWAPDAITAAVLGAVLGVVGVVWRYAGDLFAAALGVVGAAVTAQALVVGDGCSDLPPAVRVASIGLVVVLGLPAFWIGRMLPGNRSSSSLAVYCLSLFALVDVVAFVSTPLGVPVLASGSTGLVVTSALAALVLGFGFGFAPVIGALLLGAAVSFVSASSTAWVGTTCSFVGDSSQLIAGAVFGGAALAVGALLTGRRTKV